MYLLKNCFIFILILLSLISCRGSNKSNVTKDGKKVMDIIAADDTLQGGALKYVIDEYQKVNTNVSINFIEIPYGDIYTKVKMMVAGGTPPALVRVTDTAVFGNTLLELDSSLGEYGKHIIPSMQGYCYNKDKKLIAVPVSSTANGLIINKTMFDKAGIAVPTEALTWDEIEKILTEVKDKTGAKYPLVWDVSPSRWSTLLYQYGGSFFDETLTKSNFDSPEAYNALKKFKDMHDNGIMPKSVWVGGEDPSAMFKGQVAVAILSGSWKISEFNRDISDFEWAVIPIPYGTVRSTVAGGNLMAAFKNSGMEEEAKDFLNFLLSENIYKEFLKKGGFLSSFDNTGSIDYDFKKEAFDIFVKDLEISPNASGREWGENVTILTKVHPDITLELKNMIKGDQTVEETQSKINQYLENALANNN